MTLTQLQTLVTKTASFTGSAIDVSGFTGDWTLKVNVQALSDSGGATPSVRLAFEDTVNDYTASLAGPTIAMQGKLANSFDKVKSFKKQDFPDLRMGTASAQLRLKVSSLEANGSVTYQAWIES